jgi:hypothetical protein
MKSRIFKKKDAQGVHQDAPLAVVAYEFAIKIRKEYDR